MSQNLTISKTGLKLIKAFEGYRPVDRELITGQRIVGYGHRLYSEDAVMMNKGEAESVLMSDLAPFEDMINSEVHAPMTQSQFDALCSFAFNIGPKAFLQSDTLRAINNGRPLDAANSLDIWRKSEIDGKTYVVDALMRRRTAEKALFLRTEHSVPAGRSNLPPIKDTALTGLTTDDGLPVLTEKAANGIVATAPYTASETPSRRREDGPAGMLQLSERDVIEDAPLDEIEPETPELDSDALAQEMKAVENLEDVATDIPDEISLDDEMPLEPEPRKSPIAAAATDIVARLDALIEDVDARFDDAEDDRLDSALESDKSFVDDDVLENIIEDEIPDETLSDDTFQDEAESNLIEINKGETLASRIMNERINRKDDVTEDDAVASAEDEKPVPVIDELAQDDAIRQRTDSAAKYIETTEPAAAVVPEPKEDKNLGLWILILLGFILIGLAGGAMIGNSESIFGEWGDIITFTGFVIGVGLILYGVYAALRMNLSR